MLHTMQPMSYLGRDARGDSLLERGILGVGERLGLLAGVVLAVSAFTGWYSGPGQGVKVSVTGWDSGYPGKLVFFKAFGFTGKAKNVPMATDTILELASMSKPMAAIRALALTEQGRLPL